jgi:hypothetical protein
MEIASGIARYLNDVPYSKWSVPNCLEFLAKTCTWITSENREEIRIEFARQLEMTSTHQSLSQKVRSKASKLFNGAEKSFQYKEAEAFFDRMDKEVHTHTILLIIC